MKLPNIILITLLISSIGVCQAHQKASEKEKENVASQYNIMRGADIRSMVQVQIDSARARDFRGEIKSCMYRTKNSQEKVYSNENSSVESKPVIEINPKVFVLFIFSTSVLVFVFVRRFIKNRKLSTNISEPESFNPETINIVKKEETNNIETEDLERLKNKLNPSIPSIKESSLPSNTKGMKIAQGEMILAAKIKSYQLAHFGNK